MAQTRCLFFRPNTNSITYLYNIIIIYRQRFRRFTECVGWTDLWPYPHAYIYSDGYLRYGSRFFAAMFIYTISILLLYNLFTLDAFDIYITSRYSFSTGEDLALKYGYIYIFIYYVGRRAQKATVRHKIKNIFFFIIHKFNLYVLDKPTLLTLPRLWSFVAYHDLVTSHHAYSNIYNICVCDDECGMIGSVNWFLVAENIKSTSIYSSPWIIAKHCTLLYTYIFITLYNIILLFAQEETRKTIVTSSSSQWRRFPCNWSQFSLQWPTETIYKKKIIIKSIIIEHKMHDSHAGVTEIKKYRYIYILCWCGLNVIVVFDLIIVNMFIS